MNTWSGRFTASRLTTVLVSQTEQNQLCLVQEANISVRVRPYPNPTETG